MPEEKSKWWEPAWDAVKTRLETVLVAAVLSLLFGGEEVWDRYKSAQHEEVDRREMWREWEDRTRMEYDLLMRAYQAEARADSCEVVHGNPDNG